MISNNQCEKCDHILVCSKQSVLEKFNDDSKKFINIDITIDKCHDFKEAE
jgi:hypothetical protein